MRLNAILYQAAAVAYVASPATARFAAIKKRIAHKDLADAAPKACAPGTTVTEYESVTSTVYVNGPAPTSDPDPNGSPGPGGQVITVIQPNGKTTVPGQGVVTLTAPGPAPSPGSPPEIVTVTVPGSGGSPPDVVTITKTAPGSDPTPPSSPDVGSPQVVTVTVPGQGVVTLTAPGPVPSPGSPPEIVTVTAPGSGGSPPQVVTITKTAPGSDPTPAASPNDGKPQVVTVTVPGQGVVTLTAPGPVPTLGAPDQIVTVTKTLLAPSVIVVTIPPQGTTITRKVGPQPLTKTVTESGFDPTVETFFPGKTITETLMGGSTVTKTLPVGVITITETVPGAAPTSPPDSGSSPSDVVITVTQTAPNGEPMVVTETSPAPPMIQTITLPQQGGVITITGASPPMSTMPAVPAGQCPPVQLTGCGTGDDKRSGIQADIITAAFAAISGITDKMTKLVTGVDLFNAFTTVATICPGFVEIIQKIGADVVTLDGLGAVPCSCGDSTAIFSGLSSLYASKTKLLVAMIAKRPLLNSFPGLGLFVIPIHAVLVGLKAIDDTLAAVTLTFVPTRTCEINAKIAALQIHFDQAFAAY
ncbi:hypothetical protein RQP46_005144 [Phenoliferia psychrophenolica]